MSKMRVAILVSLSLTLLSGDLWAADLSWCSAPDPPIGPLISPTKSSISVRIVFIAFPETTPLLPIWADSLATDMRAFIRTMAGDSSPNTPAMNVDLQIVKQPGADSVYAWMAPEPASYYYSHSTAELNKAIMVVIGQTYNPNPTAGVDAVLTVAYKCTSAFIPPVGKGCDIDYGTTGLLFTDLTGISGWSTIPQGTTTHMNLDIPGDHINYKPAQEAIMTHEFLHLFGFSHPPGSGNVKLGRYDLQSGSQGGFYHIVDQGLIPINPFTIIHPDLEPGWAPLSVPLSRDTLDLPVPDFFGHQLRSERKTYIIELTHTGVIQSFFLVNHQGATAYDSKYLGSGLLIWHLLDPLNKDRGFRDLELASGKSPNPIDGEDALELSTPQAPYWGSAGDFFDGNPEANFSYSTNPNTNLYNVSNPPTFYDAAQDVPTGFAVENIRRNNSNGDMIIDVYLDKAQLIESPNGGSETPNHIQRGSSVIIHWRVRPELQATAVDLEISENGSVLSPQYRSLAAGIPNTGSFTWPVLQKGGTDYRIRLKTHGPGGSPDILGIDTSNNAYHY